MEIWEILIVWPIGNSDGSSEDFRIITLIPGIVNGTEPMNELMNKLSCLFADNYYVRCR